MTVPFLHRLVAAAALCAAATAALAHAYEAGTLKIAHPWARFTVAGQQAGGAFLTVQNTGAAPDRLLGASTPAADRVELHTMAMDGQVMKMRQVDAIELPAGQSVPLQPGQQHLMLMGLKAPLKLGDKVPLTLRFEKAGELKVELAVQAARSTDEKPPRENAAASAAGHGHHH